MDSNEAIKRALRNHILDFQPLDDNGDPLGAPLRARYGGGTSARIYFDALPDNLAFPNGIARLINQRRSGAYNGERISADLEIMLYERNAANAAALEADADIVDAAMLRAKVSQGSGFMFSREGTRDTLPPSAEPESRGVVTVRLLYSVVIWPRYLTRYASVK